MATQAAIRLRRSAAQLHALAEVERDIRANTQSSRCKYLRDFQEAFRSYESVLNPTQVENAMRAADVLLVGDYHALPASQRYMAQIVERLSTIDDRGLVVGLEMVPSRDQCALDDWMSGAIDEDELRERIRFDLDWGYEWAPVAELLRKLKSSCAAVYGLDCLPRGDLRRISARDKHAAAKIAEMRQRHPEARIAVLFG